MGRLYTATNKVAGMTAQQDFLEIFSPADAVTIIHRWVLSQHTEVGDAQEEGLLITTNRGVGAVTSGSGGSVLTPQPIQDGNPAFGGVVEGANTTKLAVGTGTLETDLEVYSWNVRVPFERIYTPEERPILSPSTFWTLELETTPGDAISYTVTVVFEELGG